MTSSDVKNDGPGVEGMPLTLGQTGNLHHSDASIGCLLNLVLEIGETE